MSKFKFKQFVRIRPEMLRSPAYRALSRTGFRIRACIEIELCKRGGKLIVTYKAFEQYGIHHHAIGPGLRELEALGFITITQRGLAGNADQRRPHMFKLTYLPTDDGKPPTDEWQRIANIEEAEAVAAKTRATVPRGYPRLGRKRTNSQCRKTRKPMPETGSGKVPFSMPETGSDNPKTPMPETGSTI
jgi:hypothetical protein